MNAIVQRVRDAGKTLYRWWMVFAHALGYVNTKILLTLFYVVVIGPMWLIHAALRIDPLDRRIRVPGTYWKSKEPVDHRPEAARHQF